MRFFRIKYFLSGRYPSKLVAQIIRWENGQLTLKDQNGRLHDIKESNITSIATITIKEAAKKREQENVLLDQGTLF